MNRMIWYDPIEGEYSEAVMIDKILRLSKSEDGEETLIHLVNGTILRSEDSMLTLRARINSEEEY